MSSAPYTFWAIVLIFSRIGVCGKGSTSAKGGYTHTQKSPREEGKLDQVNRVHICMELTSKKDRGNTVNAFVAKYIFSAMKKNTTKPRGSKATP